MACVACAAYDLTCNFQVSHYLAVRVLFVMVRALLGRQVCELCAFGHAVRVYIGSVHTFQDRLSARLFVWSYRLSCVHLRMKQYVTYVFCLRMLVRVNLLKPGLAIIAPYRATESRSGGICIQLLWHAANPLSAVGILPSLEWTTVLPVSFAMSVSHHSLANVS